MRRALTALMFWCALLGVPPTAAAAAATADTTSPIRIGLTPVFLHDQTGFVNAWRAYLQSRLNRPVVFVQRASYREITELLRNGKLDFAWLCGYPFVNNRAHVNLLAVPIYRGRSTYQSYLIVPSTDTQTTTIADLRDKVFAFSDPDSNSGYLVPVHDLHQIGEKSGTFFGKTFFTWSHRKVVEAVAAGLAQGGAVDGYVWDTLALQDPQLTGRTRVVKASMEFGFPPFVSGKAVSHKTATAMRDALLAMSDDPDGIRLLARLRLDGFVAGNERMFDDIARMKRAIAGK